VGGWVDEGGWVLDGRDGGLKGRWKADVWIYEGVDD
jgi:hypothetical protein